MNGHNREDFDEQGMLSLFGNDRDLAKMIIQSATADIPGYLEQIDRAIASGVWKDAERATHTMKGLAAQIGGTRLAKLFKEANDRMKRGETLNATEAANLRQEYALLLECLSPWL